MNMKNIKVINYSKLWTGILVTSVAAILLCFLLLPLFKLLTKAFTDDNGKFIYFDRFIEYFNSPAMLSSLTHTLTISTLSTIIAIS
ncbi:MAG: hypothetical protein ACRCUS_09920, partial [Anaerovoracaceae bacterium]